MKRHDADVDISRGDDESGILHDDDGAKTPLMILMADGVNETTCDNKMAMIM